MSQIERSKKNLKIDLHILCRSIYQVSLDSLTSLTLLGQMASINVIYSLYLPASGVSTMRLLYFLKIHVLAGINANSVILYFHRQTAFAFRTTYIYSGIRRRLHKRPAANRASCSVFHELDPPILNLL